MILFVLHNPGAATSLVWLGDLRVVVVVGLGFFLVYFDLPALMECGSWHGCNGHDGPADVTVLHLIGGRRGMFSV